MPRPVPSYRAYKVLCDAVATGDSRALSVAIDREPEAARHWKPIVDAAFKGRADMVRVLLAAGADPDVVSGTASRHTPLTRVTQHHATIPRHSGHVEVVTALLEAGADPNLRGGPLDVEPLAYAAMTPKQEFVDALRDAGTSVGAHLAAVL